MHSVGLIGKLYILCQWITRIMYSNALWLIVNLPITYLTFNIFVINTPEQLIVNLILISILSPFLLFPSTTALCGITRKWVLGEHDVSIFKSYFKYYKENYKKSFVSGLIFVPLWIILIVDYVYFTTVKSPLVPVFLAVGMFMLAFTINFFSNTVHYDLKFINLLKNSLLLSIGRPLHTIGITALCIIVTYISFNIFPFLILLGWGSIISFGSFYIYHRGITVKEQVIKAKSA